MPFTADDLAGQYGFAAAFFNSDPELKRILDQAVREQWSPDRFKSTFVATNWYRTKSDTVRQMLELQSRDPNTWNSKLDNEEARVTNMAAQLGVHLDSGTWRQLASNSLMFGWNDDVLRKGLSDFYGYSKDNGTGQASTIDARVRQLANDYGVTISDGEVAKLVRDSVRGTVTDDSLVAYAKNMAMSKYAGMRGYLQEGFTVKQVASPYIQSYAQLLEQDANSVQLTDPLLQKALQGTPDPKAGGLPTMQSLYQFEQSVRQDKRWLNTKNARDDVENVAMGVLRDWGIHA